jgi:hypothetical protein
MGYTHYFDQVRSFTDDEWSKITERAKDILSQEKNIINHDPKSDQKLTIDDEVIRFNGIGDESHETFYLPKDKPEEDEYLIDGKTVQELHPGPYFHFCKTAGKDYDKYVTAILIIANGISKDALKVESDGDADLWMDGLDIANVGSVLNPEFQIPKAIYSRKEA